MILSLGMNFDIKVYRNVYGRVSTSVYNEGDDDSPPDPLRDPLQLAVLEQLRAATYPAINHGTTSQEQGERWRQSVLVRPTAKAMGAFTMKSAIRRGRYINLTKAKAKPRAAVKPKVVKIAKMHVPPSSAPASVRPTCAPHVTKRHQETRAGSSLLAKPKGLVAKSLLQAPQTQPQAPKMTPTPPLMPPVIRKDGWFRLPPANMKDEALRAAVREIKFRVPSLAWEMHQGVSKFMLLQTKFKPKEFPVQSFEVYVLKEELDRGLYWLHPCLVKRPSRAELNNLASTEKETENRREKSARCWGCRARLGYIDRVVSSASYVGIRLCSQGRCKMSTPLGRMLMNYIHFQTQSLLKRDPSKDESEVKVVACSMAAKFSILIQRMLHIAFMRILVHRKRYYISRRLQKIGALKAGLWSLATLDAATSPPMLLSESWLKAVEEANSTRLQARAPLEVIPTFNRVQYLSLPRKYICDKAKFEKIAAEQIERLRQELHLS